jgi:transposase
MSKDTIVCAGIDTSKRKLDVAIHASAQRLQVDNTADGHAALSAWLRQHLVERVGIEASGGYEQEVVAHLRREGVVVIVFQPAQVRAYARFLLQRAKTDRIDAGLIAACTAATQKIHAPPDPRLAPLAEQMTLIDQLKDDEARFKNRLESCHDAHNREFWKAEISRSKRLKKIEIRALARAVRQHQDLAERLDLILSVDGVGLPTALAILVRMPEIGRITREQAASLVGLAPFDDAGADREGERHIAGGRARLRERLYMAAFPAAMHWNPELMALYERLTAAGKQHKVALVACARKLLIFVNTVVERGTPWVSKRSPSAALEPAT